MHGPASMCIQIGSGSGSGLSLSQRLFLRSFLSLHFFRFAPLLRPPDKNLYSTTTSHKRKAAATKNSLLLLLPSFPQPRSLRRTSIKERGSCSTQLGNNYSFLLPISPRRLITCFLRYKKTKKGIF